jgi:hypothetical protein
VNIWEICSFVFVFVFVFVVGWVWINCPLSFLDLCLFIYIDIRFVGEEGGEKGVMSEETEQNKTYKIIPPMSSPIHIDDHLDGERSGQGLG